MLPRRPIRILRGLSAIHRAPPRTVVAVGVFDGVHRGHRRILRAAVRLARRQRALAVALTFDPDPQCVLAPAQAAPALMPLADRVRALAATGVDWVLVVPFTQRFAHMTGRQFIDHVLVGRLHACTLVVGEHFRFGRGQGGNLALLRRLGPSRGLDVVFVPEVRHGGAPISSSRIRRLIAAGELAQARVLLGRPAALYGRVVPGAGRGRRLGFPTANVALREHVLPPQGVYAVTVERPGARWRGPGVMNLGVRPTFGGGPVVCEVHVLGFSGSLRGAALVVHLLMRLRAERCFANAAALRQHIQRDVQRARRLTARLFSSLR